MEIQRQGAVQHQPVAACDAAAPVVALLARIARFVVELAEVVHGAEVAALPLAEIVTEFGGDSPKGVASVAVVTAPRCPRTARKDAETGAGDAVFDAEVGGERSPAKEVEVE